MFMVLNEKKVTTFLEEKEKGNSILYMLKIEMIASLLPSESDKICFSIENNEKKVIVFPFQSSKTPKLQLISNKYI